MVVWLIIFVVCYIFVNIYLIMYIISLGDEIFLIIIGGVMILWNSGFYFIVMIIFLVSVVVLFVKVFILSFLCFMVM